MNTNTTQITATLAPIVTFFAGLLAGKGVFGWDAATWASVIGGGLGLLGTVYAAWQTTKTKQISSVAQMPEVQQVKLEPSAPSAIQTATPSNVVK